MSIGRNYRLALEKTLREINKSREMTMSCKILDEDRHLLNRPRQKGESEPYKTKSTNDYKCTGVVPLAVNQYLYMYINIIIIHNEHYAFDLSYYLWPIGVFIIYFFNFVQDLLSGKYYKDKAELREQKMIEKKIKSEKAMIKPELPSK